MENYYSNGQAVTAAPAKKKSKLPLILGIVAVLAVAVAAVSALLGGTLAMSADGTVSQFEKWVENGALNEMGLLGVIDSHSEERLMRADFEVAKLDSSLFGEDASMYQGTTLKIEEKFSCDDEKMSLSAEAVIAGMVSIGAEMYADEDVIQVSVPTLTENVFELKNEDILGQITSVLPELFGTTLSGGKINFEKKDFEEIKERFTERYGKRLEAAASDIKVEKGEALHRVALGKNSVKCDTYEIIVPASAIKEMAMCVVEFVASDESVKPQMEMIANISGTTYEAFAKQFVDETERALEKIDDDETQSFFVYTAKKGLFGSCVVGVYAEVEDFSVELSLMGKKNIFDNVELLIEKDGEKLIIGITQGDLYITDSENELMNIDTEYDKKSNEYSCVISAGTVEVTMAFEANQKHNTFTADELSIAASVNGKEAVLLEGGFTIDNYEAPEKISQTPVEFNLQNVLSIFTSVLGGLI